MTTLFGDEKFTYVEVTETIQTKDLETTGRVISTPLHISLNVEETVLTGENTDVLVTGKSNQFSIVYITLPSDGFNLNDTQIINIYPNGFKGIVIRPPTGGKINQVVNKNITILNDATGFHSKAVFVDDAGAYIQSKPVLYQFRYMGSTIGWVATAMDERGRWAVKSL